MNESVPIVKGGTAVEGFAVKIEYTMEVWV